MNRKPIKLDPDMFPEGIRTFLNSGAAFDSSCSPEARVIYIEKEGGLFLKEAPAGTLRTEAMMTSYMHSLNLSAEVLYYGTHGSKDYMVTGRITGEDCTHPVYMRDPKRLCDTTASLLRQLHESIPGNCPVTDRNRTYIETVRQGFDQHAYEPDLFVGLYEFVSFEEAKHVSEKGFSLMKREVLLHGDYCLPNIILDHWQFSGFIDVGNGGIGDRHIDILWGIWTLKNNLGTTEYTDRFIDAYGRDKVETDKLRFLAAMEMIGG